MKRHEAEALMHSMQVGLAKQIAAGTVAPHAERVEVCRNLDVAAFLRILPTTPIADVGEDGRMRSVEEICLAAMHKARAHDRQNFTKAEARKSKQWLKANGWKLLGGS